MTPMTSMTADQMSTLFVQIASYRDPELIPTLHDLVNRAEFPCRLRIVVSWQHGTDETLGGFFLEGFQKWRLQPDQPFCVHTFDLRGATVELIDIPHELSQGACWARNLIQQRYQEETYTLQLDSHHRFVPHWDTQLIAMQEQLRARSPKPLLTAYLPAYTPAAPHPGDQGASAALGMRFDRFTPESPIFFRAFELPEWQSLPEPVPARFYSGHFTFADGSFAREVQHDPEYFFHGEEISLAVRAYTHGYALYHPHRNLARHEYSREGRPKFWDDHDGNARDAGRVSQAWWERNARSLARNRALFGMEDASAPAAEAPEAKYGFGQARTLADYEAYAGISFSDRAVQPEVIACQPPGAGAPLSDPASWRATLRRSHDLHISAHRSVFDIQACTEATQVRVRALRADGSVLHEDTATIESSRSHCKNDWFDRRLAFLCDLSEQPAAYQIAALDANQTILAKFEKALTA